MTKGFRMLLSNFRNRAPTRVLPCAMLCFSLHTTEIERIISALASLKCLYWVIHKIISTHFVLYCHKNIIAGIRTEGTAREDLERRLGAIIAQLGLFPSMQSTEGAQIIFCI